MNDTTMEDIELSMDDSDCNENANLAVVLANA